MSGKLHTKAALHQRIEHPLSEGRRMGGSVSWNGCPEVPKNLRRLRDSFYGFLSMQVQKCSHTMNSSET